MEREQQPSTRLATATAAKSGSTVACAINGVATIVQVARDLSVSSGDVVILNRYGGQWVATGRMFAAAPAVITDVGGVPPDPTPGTASGVIAFGPVETRSYRNGAWRTDNTAVYQGSYGGGGNHTGCAFYGSGPRSLVGATVTAAYVVAQRTSGGAFAAQSSTMRLMTQATRPAGAPTLGASTAGPLLAVGATNNAFFIPNSWAQAMVDGTAGGLAFFVAGGSPYIRFAGTGEWSPAWTMIVYWTR